MPATDFDRMWFKAHPDRAYRLRPVPRDEALRWFPVPPREGWTAYCIVRRSDGATEQCSIEAPNTLDDYDDELQPVFDQLRREDAA